MQKKFLGGDLPDSCAQVQRYALNTFCPFSKQNTGLVVEAFPALEWNGGGPQVGPRHSKVHGGPSNVRATSCGATLLLARVVTTSLPQANASSEEDALLRQQTVNAQVAILQQLQQQLGALGGKEAGPEGGQLQQAQLTQLQALLLLQQHQQIHQQQQQQQQQQQDVEAQSQQVCPFSYSFSSHSPRQVCRTVVSMLYSLPSLIPSPPPFPLPPSATTTTATIAGPASATHHQREHFYHHQFC